MARLCALAATVAGALAASPWPPSVRQQAAALVAQLNLTEKVGILHGYGNQEPAGYVGETYGIPKIGLPNINEEDGPQGVADQVTNVTSWPSSLTVAASWDRALMNAYGVAMGAEQSGKGTNIMLGPGVCLARIPWGGRNFEYLGEDPFLASELVFAEVQGIQSNNVSACVKHFILNNQEHNRDTVSANVNQRAFMELYTRPYQAAVDAGVASAMCSYNRVNRTYACENNATLGWLKNTAGFAGFVMSDWGAAHSTVPAAFAGLDQEQPDSQYFGQALVNAVQTGQVPESVIDDKATRIVTAFLALGMMDSQRTNPTGSLTADVRTPAHTALARQLATESTVLLKNEGGLLPLDATAVKRIAVLGDALTVHGWGSGGVFPSYISTPYSGIYRTVNGLTPPSRTAADCTVLAGQSIQTPAAACIDASSEDFCASLIYADASYDGYTFIKGRQCNSWGASGAGGQCWPGSGPFSAQPNSAASSMTCKPVPAPATAPRVNVTVYSGPDTSVAAALAAGADAVVVSLAMGATEGDDRDPSMALPAWQVAVLEAAAAANPSKTIAVTRCPGACVMPFAASVPVVISSLMPGQEAGNALAAILFGLANPSGKLPISFPASTNDTWLSLPNVGGPVNPELWPGTDRGLGFDEADYTEDLLIGYRWFDSQPSLTPLWPFGAGLSYSTFTYSALTVSGAISASGSGSVTVSFSLANTAGPAGAEVPQLYIAKPAAANSPPKELRGFTKLQLAAGASSPVSFTLAAQDVAIWDVAAQGWTVVPGAYTVYVGSSSRDIRLMGSFTVA